MLRHSFIRHLPLLGYGLILLSICFFAQVATCQTLYVTPTGNDATTNGTTEATAYKTIQKALQKAKSDVNITTIRVKTGTYKERIAWTSAAGARSGTSAKPLTLASYGGKATLDGTGTTNQPALIYVQDMSYITIRGFIIQNNTMEYAVGIHVKGSGKSITIDSCEIFNINCTATGSQNANPLTVVGSSLIPISDLTISNNKIHDCKVGTSEGLTVNGNVNGFKIIKNTVYNLPNIGIDIAGHRTWVWEGAAADAAKFAAINKPRNGWVQDNTVYKCVSPIATSAGIYVDGADSTIIERNISYENGAGYSIGCEVPGFTILGITLRDNVAYNNKRQALVFGSNQSTSSVNNSRVWNNSFFKNYTKHDTIKGVVQEGAEVSIQRNNGSTNSFKQNIFVPSTDKDWSIGYWGGAASDKPTMNYNLHWRYTSSKPLSSFLANVTAGTNDMSVNPGVANAATFDLRLTASSGAKDKGDPSFQPASGETALGGGSRVKGVVDIGAYEF